ncbi:MAG: hypothetical protein HY934_03365, partial [Candidatus Firestonebacteria bacterium]|nr:hypothetical protein [Candidatus Firestonebacteria bacterium]
MKLFIISAQYPPIKCRIGDYVANLCLYFKWKSDIDPYVITSSASDIPNSQVTDDGVYIHRIMENWGIFEVSKIMKLIKKENPQIVHIQYDFNSFSQKWMLSILPFLIKKYRRKIKVVTSFSDFSNEINKNFNT